MISEKTSSETRPIKKRKTIIVLIALLIVLGFLILAGGLSVLVYNLETDNEGYAYSNIYHVNTSTYAFTLYMNQYNISTWGFLGAENIAQIKFIVQSTDSSKELFTGYTTTSTGEPYRKSFLSELPTYWLWWAEPYYSEIYINTTAIEGVGAPAQVPQTQTIWLTSSHSNNTAEMTYLPLHQQHIWFIMNLDGSKNITADIQIAFRSPILMMLPYLLIPLGSLSIIGGIYLFKRKKKRIQ